MSTISETNKCGQNSLENFDISLNFSFNASDIGAWLLVIKTLYTRYLTSCRTT